MFSQSLNTADLSAPLPLWAVFVSLALIAVVSAILVTSLPAPPAGEHRAAAPAVIPRWE